MKMTHAQFADQCKKMSELNGLLAYAYTIALMQFKVLFPDGPRPMLDTTHRSEKQQEVLYNQGRSKPGKVVTHKRPGQSKHNSFPAKAFDIKMVFADGSATWEEKYFVKFFHCIDTTGVKINWGGHFKTLLDMPHFEID